MAKMPRAQATVRTLASSIRSSTLPIAFRISARREARGGARRRRRRWRGIGVRWDHAGAPNPRVLPPPPSPEKNSAAFYFLFLSPSCFGGVPELNPRRCVRPGRSLSAARAWLACGPSMSVGAGSVTVLVGGPACHPV